VRELRRLLDLHDGYAAIYEGEPPRGEAARSFGMAEIDVGLADLMDAAYAGDVERARQLIAPLLGEEPRWAMLVRVLGSRGLLPHADEIV
jgi:hypothetical protein